ncbi:hypothetical protein [Streptomyces sp. IB2014 016-6]|uniref:hypothetical protein n=1 Tax=Streptomyces sp. IB2014 016-6 TaxID=2517818 RepID=UPI00165094EC|nr:hypothetical protein [Streptomyces sp. IB2014 016-6]
MTQSGQRDESQSPAARPAHEGIVLPADGGPPLIPGAPAADQSAPAGGQPWGQPWGPGAPQPEPQGQPQGHQLPPPQAQQPDPGAHGSYDATGAYGGGGYGYPQAPQQQYQPPQQQEQQYQPLPPAQPQAQPPQQQYGAPQGGTYGAQPLPAETPPPAAPGGPLGSADATQYIPPVPAAGAADATQYIPPVPPQYHQGRNPGGLPPERPAESTQYLGTVQQSPPAAATSDTDATQFIAPVPAQGPGDIPAAPPGAPYGIRPGAPGDRQPPAEFDSLFRSEDPGAGQVPDETQQLPQFDPAAGPGAGPGRGRGGPQGRGRQGHPQQGYGQGGAPPPYGQPPRGPQEPSGPQGRAAGRRKSSPIPLIAAVVVGCAVLGLGAGWLMSGDDSKKQDNNQTVSSESSPSGPGEDEQPADPAKPQAEELDKLLAESNDSRAAVISAVESIKTCENLDKAVSDLQGAADQRRDLVTRLKELTLDKLPQHAQLSSSLTKAWQASASADDHYATWAGEAKTKKGCKGGKARTTKAASEGHAASGEATAAKRKASGLWNGIATKYGLTERAPTEL